MSETAGDLEAAVDWLRKKGLSAAAKKAGRVAAEGLVGVAIGGGAGALVEVNAETDFVARNEQFQSFVRAVADAGARGGRRSRRAESGRAIRAAAARVGDELTELIATIGENMSVRRAARAHRLARRGGVLHAQRAGAQSRQDRRVGRARSRRADAGKLADFGAQARACMSPPPTRNISTSPRSMPKSLDRERDVLREQARASGKADAIIDKMVEGRLRKFYEETVLLGADLRHRRRNADRARSSSRPPRNSARRSRWPGFARFALGEGIEKDPTDFAAEVAATVKK